MMTIHRAYTTCRYGQMHYRAAGIDSGKHALVLFHQNPSSSFEYEALIKACASDRRVIAFDTPGYGMSDSPPAPPGIPGYAAAFSDALDALGLTGPLDCYGFHTGTLHTIELALLRPDLVDRIALTGIPMHPPEVRTKKLRDALSYPAIDEQGEVVKALLANLWSYAVTNRDAAVPLDKAVWNFADKAKVLHHFTWAYKAVWEYDFSRLSEVTQPALLLQPEEDIASISRAAAVLMPNCAVRNLPNLDRDIFDVAPEMIADAIRSFFD